MQKCTTCQYYDRKHAKGAAGNGAPSQQGQCRRMAPMLSPVNARSYLIEGVWPTVRDDDWCGEWKLVGRRTDLRPSELAPGAASAGLRPTVPHVARIGASIGVEPAVASAPVKPFLATSSAPVAGAADAAPVTAAAAGVLSGAD